MTAYYNEFDPYAAQWLRNLIEAGHIAPGVVDERSIEEVSADDLEGFTQCHFFAGIGGWSIAARLAGWPDDEPLWTGSCPCQPFSAAGNRKGTSDERHLWPVFFNLIRQCRPPAVVGEQVASRLGREWFSGVRADLETLAYAVGGADLCAAGVGAPHIRQRLWWVASQGLDDTTGSRRSPQGAGAKSQARDKTRLRGFERGRDGRRLADAGCISDERGRGLGEAQSAARADGEEAQQLQRCGPDAGSSGSGSGMADRQSDGWKQGEQDGGRSNQGTEAKGKSRCTSGRCGSNGMADADELGQTGQQGGRREAGNQLTGGSGGMGNASGPRLSSSQRETVFREGRQVERGAAAESSGAPSPWGYAAWIDCADGKARRIEPSIEPLAHGIPARVGRLRAYGNAIVPQVAAEVLKAFMASKF